MAKADKDGTRTGRDRKGKERTGKIGQEGTGRDRNGRDKDFLSAFLSVPLLLIFPFTSFYYPLPIGDRESSGRFNEDAAK
jgi:hypothetical protein